MWRYPRLDIMVMVTGVGLEALLEGLPNVTSGCADTAPIGEEIVRIKKRVIRMTPRSKLVRGVVTRTAGRMPERKYHHLGIIIKMIKLIILIVFFITFYLYYLHLMVHIRRI